MNKKNRLLHLWNKLHYGVRYKVGLKYFLFHIHFYSIFKGKNGVDDKNALNPSDGMADNIRLFFSL